MVASNQIFPRPGAGSVGKLRGSDSHESHLPDCHALSIKEPLRRLLSEPQRRGEVTKKLPNRQQLVFDMQFLSGWPGPTSHYSLKTESFNTFGLDSEKCRNWRKNITFHPKKFDINLIHTYICKLYGFWTVQTESFFRFQNQLFITK